MSSSYDKMYRKLNNVIINSQPKGSIDEKRLRGCLSKIGYDTESEASIMAAKRDKTVY